MTGSPSNPHSVARPDERDPRALLDKLRAGLSTEGVPTQLTQTLDGLETALNRVLIEHEGMSQELLSVYEQLGVVFEVSSCISAVRGEPRVVALFLDSLRRTFHRLNVWVAARDRAGQWIAQDGSSPVEGWLPKYLENALASRRVVVESISNEEGVANVSELMIGPVFAGESFVCAIVLERPLEPSTPAFAASDMGLLQALTTFCGDLIRKKRLVGELHTMSIAMVRALVNAVDQKDEYTSGHSLRVAFFATLIGRELNLPEKELQMLQWSALLHDVGKIGIRDDVLKKAGKLTDEEFAHMKEHPVRSHRVVQQVPQLSDALAGVLHHHERFDGKGYPLGLAGEDIPLQARIIQIADVFDALTSTRSYRSAFQWTKALQIMQEEAGKTLDPRLQQLFDGMMRKRLEGSDNAWEQLVAKANQFIADTAVEGSESGDE